MASGIEMDGGELVRLVAASVRLSAAANDAANAHRALLRVVEIAPDLDPEIDAACARIEDLIGHLYSAIVVVRAKLDQLSRGGTV